MTTTLEQFRRQTADTTGTREGWERFPDKAEDAEIERRALAAGIQHSALVDVFEAYVRNEFDLNSMDSWLEERKIIKPHMFPSVGVYALASQAFSENGVLDLAARGRLVQEVGEATATAMAKQWGLTGLNDFKTKGVQPEAANSTLAGHVRQLEAEIASKTAELNKAKAALPPDNKPSSNPFTRLRNADGSLNEQVQQQISGMIRAFGTEKVAAIARAVGRRIDGTMIPQKFRGV